MKLEHEPRQRCGECGAQCPTLLRMERGPPFCFVCLRAAARTVFRAMDEREQVRALEDNSRDTRGRHR